MLNDDHSIDRDVLNRFPAPQGLGSVVGYIALGASYGTRVAQRYETVSWNGQDEQRRSARIPAIYFLKGNTMSSPDSTSGIRQTAGGPFTSAMWAPFALDTRRVLVQLWRAFARARRHSHLWPILLRDEALVRSRLAELFS